MKRLSSLAILAVFSVGLASPAFAKISITKGERICKTAISSQTPAPKSAKTSKSETRVVGDEIHYAFRITLEDGSKDKLICAVDRMTEETTLTSAD